MSRQGSSATERVLKCTATFAVTFFFVGQVASAIDIYVFGHYEPKFGPGGTFELGLLILAIVDAGLTLLCGLAAFCFRRILVRAEPFWRIVALFAAVAVLCVAIVILLPHVFA